MPDHARHQPLNRRGVTLVELLVAVTTAAVIALVSAQLFKVAVMTYNYTYRQNAALSAFRGTLSGVGSHKGVLEASRTASAANSLAAGSLSVSTNAVTTSFVLSTGTVVSAVSTTTYRLGDAMTTLTVAYYNLDSSGLVMVSTSAGSATFVTTLMTLTNSAGKTFRSYAGARLRNHP